MLIHPESFLLLIVVQGFGFVTMSTASSAHLARMCLDGVTVEGRRIEVNPATPKAPLAAKSVPPPVVSSKSPVVKENNIQLRVLEAQARLAEAQVAVLHIQHRIMSSRHPPTPVLGRNIQ